MRIDIADGAITRVTPNAPREGAQRIAGFAIPGLPNLHCHAFQRGMAGLAERRGPAHDSFWTWREVMYRFLGRLTPDDVEAIAAFAYMQMLETGFTAVGEFHYLHHDIDGRPYADLGEMAARIAAAAEATGIGLTLLPVLYMYGGFGGAAPNEGQRRFLNDPDRYAALLARSREIVKALPDARVGIAPHSLRAVTPDALRYAVTETYGDKPIHIHAAEQTKEVADCIAALKATPVAWLLDNADVDARWCLIHATHMTEDETRRLAASGAVAGLVPAHRRPRSATASSMARSIWQMTGDLASAPTPTSRSERRMSCACSNTRSACDFAHATWLRTRASPPAHSFMRKLSRAVHRRSGAKSARSRQASAPTWWCSIPNGIRISPASIRRLMLTFSSPARGW